MLQFYQQIWSTTARQQIILIALAILISVIATVPLEFQRHIINSLAGHERLSTLGELCGGYLAASLLVTALKWILNLRSSSLGENNVRIIRERLFDNRSTIVMADAQASQQAHKTGTLLTMISTEAEKVGRFAGEALSAPLVEAGTLLSVLCYMLYTEPALGAVVLVLAVPQGFFVPWVQQKINLLVSERVKTLRQANDLVVETVDDGTGGKADAVRQIFVRVVGLQLGVYRLKFGSRALTNGANSIAVAAILFIGGWMVFGGRTEIGIVVAFLSGFDKIIEPSRQLTAFFRSLSSVRVQADLIAQALATNNSVTPNATSI
jgi:ABC-type multidrug transport system fused ATPase/permease subunit